jgi:hypothetical protein
MARARGVLKDKNAALKNQERSSPEEPGTQQP